MPTQQAKNCPCGSRLLQVYSRIGLCATCLFEHCKNCNVRIADVVKQYKGESQPLHLGDAILACERIPPDVPSDRCRLCDKALRKHYKTTGTCAACSGTFTYAAYHKNYLKSKADSLYSEYIPDPSPKTQEETPAI